jgi:peptide methionine sulfoxide reductase msrA/msrB
LSLVALALALALGSAACSIVASQDNSIPPALVPRPGEDVSTFAGGCFWCMEPPFEGMPGVRSVMSGFSGGKEKNPSYKQVSSGLTGHAEAVQIIFDPKVVSYAQLLDVYFRSIDPTDDGGQFADRGKQYRPAIFVHDARQRAAAEEAKRELAASGRFDRPIVVEITDFGAFYPAETYHQNYYGKDPERYRSYRKASGRQGFLEEAWGSDIGHRKDARYKKPADSQLKKSLTQLQYYVTQQGGTEPPFENAYWDNHQRGIYVDVVSGEPLFGSADKFESGTGWPSFTRPLVPDNIVEEGDRSAGMLRIEVRSKHGDSHLGHVFSDGPAPTGLRYCINSAALRFIPYDKLDAEGYGEFKRLL